MVDDHADGGNVSRSCAPGHDALVAYTDGVIPEYVRFLRSRVGTARLLIVSAAGCIRDPQGRVLLQKRGDEANLWGFPGGLMEPGESVAQACAREVREETGLEVRVGRLIGVYSSPEYQVTYPNGDQTQPVILLFECEPVAGILRPDGDETVELRYFGRDDHLPPMRPCCQMKLHDALADSGEVFIR